MSEQMEDLTVGIIDEPNPGEEDDKLGIERHAAALTKFIRHTATPLTIGIQGEWGSGKTSLLNSIYSSLENDKYLQVWINSWEHSLLSSPEETLIKIINEILHEMLKGDISNQRKKQIQTSAANLIKGALRVSATIVGGAAGGKEMDKIVGDDTNSIKSLRNNLRELAEEIKIRPTNPYQKIIIYVDDLDRIEPKDAVKILELLKNIFNIPNCVFVLAIDYQVVVKGLEHKFGKRTDENEWEFRAFFDKIIQLPFMMPMGQYSIGKYVNDLLQQIGFIDNEDAFEEEIEEIISYTIGGNPRSLKRLVNSLALINIFSDIDDEADNADEDEKVEEVIDQKLHDTKDLSLFGLVCLQISFPKIYDLLVQNPDFKKWDDDLAFKVTEKKEEKEKDKFDEEFKIVEKTKEFDDPWEKALFRICFTSPRYRSRVTDLSKFLNYLDKEILSNLDKKEEQGFFIAEIIDKTSVTSVTATDDAQNKAAKPFQRLITDNSDEGLQTYFVRNRWDRNRFSEVRELLQYIDDDLSKNFAGNYRFQYSPSMGSTFYKDKDKIGGIEIFKGGKNVAICLYRHPENDFKKPIIKPLKTTNYNVIYNPNSVDWYKLLISSKEEYERAKSQIHKLVGHSADAMINIKAMKKKKKKYPLNFNKTSAYNKKTGKCRSKEFAKYISDDWTYEV